jgi:hypothetical protein
VDISHGCLFQDGTLRFSIPDRKILKIWLDYACHNVVIDANLIGESWKCETNINNFFRGSRGYWFPVRDDDRASEVLLDLLGGFCILDL